MSAKKIVRATLFTTFILTSLSAFSAPKLRLIGDQNIPTGEKFKETEVGGLSGLTFDKANNKILAISDDRSAVNDARFYEFDLKLDEKNFKVNLSEVSILKDKEGKPFKKGMVDFEGITLINGELIVSSEGWINKEPPINPEIFHFNRNGEYKSNIEIPSQFMTQKDTVKFGPRDNLVFEGLSATRDGQTLWVGMEEALTQDDRTSTPFYESTLRLIQYKGLKPGKQFAYKLAKVPSIKVAGLTVGETGLSEILAVDENHFYSIERSYLPLAKKNVIRIFYNTVTDKTTDVSKMDSFNKTLKELNLVEKELIADLDEFKAQMSANFQGLDNIEGITFGPALSNGHDTIILVSDNNFSKNQRTQFLAFEIIP
jgi:hypothetical protein